MGDVTLRVEMSAEGDELYRESAYSEISRHNSKQEAQTNSLLELPHLFDGLAIILNFFVI